MAKNPNDSQKRPGRNGNPPPPGGRPKGIPNKSTTQAREAIAMFVEGNVERLTSWLDEIAADNPKAAFDSFMSVVEYHIPKLQRTEHQPLDKNGEKADAVTKIVIEHVRAGE